MPREADAALRLSTAYAMNDLLILINSNQNDEAPSVPLACALWFGVATGRLYMSVTFELRPIFELRDATLKPISANSQRKNYWKVP